MVEQAFSGDNRVGTSGQICIPDESVVRAGEELLPLCKMCIKSRLSCENDYVREVMIPLEPGDDPSLEVILQRRQSDGSHVSIRTGEKDIDGVEAGIYTKEEEIPIPYICEWFSPKSLG